jgi:hypothetical protein
MRKVVALAVGVALATAAFTSTAASASATTCTPSTRLEKPTTNNQGENIFTAHYNTCGQPMTLSFKSRIYHEGRYEWFARYFNLQGTGTETVGSSGCGGEAVKGQYLTTLTIGQTLYAKSAPKTFTPFNPPCGG